MNIKLAKKDIFSIIIFWIIFSWIFYLNWIFWLLEFILTLIIILILYYWVYYIIKLIFKWNIKNFWYISSRVLFTISIILFLIFSILWSFVYYFNEKKPAYMPEYTLSNWEKTVIFQWMVHIWWENFYKKVSENLKKYKEEWFIHFFESVRPWSKESNEEFNKAIWFKFDKDLYENMSKLYWVTFQDYSKIIWEVSEKDINVDLSMDDIIKEYKKLNVQKEQNQEVIDISKNMNEIVNKLNSRELNLLVYVNRAVLNLLISNTETLKDLSWIWNKDIFHIILWKRNEVLADEIIKSQNKKIYVTYWLLHFDWVLKLLQEKDKNWKIIKTTNYRVIN